MATTISAFDAKNRLGRLLDRVQSGEEITITRHGHPVALLVPVSGKQGEQAQAALRTLRNVRQAMAKRGAKMSGDEVRKFITEGRR